MRLINKPTSTYPTRLSTYLEMTHREVLSNPCITPEFKRWHMARWRKEGYRSEDDER